MSKRFRGFFPVVVDVETGGFNAKKDALLEIGALTLKIDSKGRLDIKDTFACHVEPFPNANMDPKSLEINGIDPFHPFRMARPEDRAIRDFFKFVSTDMKRNGCTRAIMIGHNTMMDLNFINAAAERNNITKNPFHPFSTFDTVSLAGLTVKPCCRAPSKPPTSNGTPTKRIPPFMTRPRQRSSFAESSISGPKRWGPCGLEAGIS